jgi:1-acyl-sn-glycerol-3-phosphate acyltransferase
VFWPRYGILKKPGTAVIEFLDPIEPGLEKNAFMSHLEDVVETRSKELMRDAGFKFD